MDLAGLLGWAVSTVVVPFVVQLINTKVKDARLARWGAGTAAAAGRVVVAVADQRAKDPTASVKALLAKAVAAEATRFLADYSTTAKALGAGIDEAQTRIAGEAGKLLASAGLLR